MDRVGRRSPMYHITHRGVGRSHALGAWEPALSRGRSLQTRRVRPVRGDSRHVILYSTCRGIDLRLRPAEEHRVRVLRFDD